MCIIRSIWLVRGRGGGVKGGFGGCVGGVFGALVWLDGGGAKRGGE